MLMSTFRNLVKIFADNPNDVDISPGKMILQIRDEIIEVTLIQKELGIFVIEQNETYSAEKWIVNRLAKLPILADRILSYIEKDDNYVNLNGEMLEDINDNPNNISIYVQSVESKLIEITSEKLPGSTKVVYITSDAGEGKTTLMEQISRLQAVRYKKKESSFIILPVYLGGRPFVRFDDVVVGALTNKFRFPFLYFDTIIELVKMGALVLALDGFEEMFIESASGKDAISALGSLLQEFNSEGTLLISARKAYFDFKDINNQVQLFDNFCDNYVTFSKISLNRWNKDQFIEYGIKRGIADTEFIYRSLVSKLGAPDHPLLSRAVLVNRLFNVIEEYSVESVIDELSIENEDYFRQFIDVIIHREANMKWINKSGEAARPLLSSAEHYYLLSLIAEEMWLSSTDSLQGNVLEMFAEMACDQLGKDATVTRQVSERISQHALIVSAEKKGHFKFDHDEFRYFFLGDRISSLVQSGSISDIKSIFRKATIPQLVIRTSSIAIKSKSKNINNIINKLVQISTSEGGATFIKENCSYLLASILNNNDIGKITLKSLYFPVDIFKGSSYSNIEFDNCVFYSINITDTKLNNIEYLNCEIDKIEIGKNYELKNIKIIKEKPKSVHDISTDRSWFDPNGIISTLCNIGFEIYTDGSCNDTGEIVHEEDDNLVLCKRAIRPFIRSTNIIDEVFKVRLGSDYVQFIEILLPDLINHGILKEVDYRGSGKHRLFKMGIKMSEVEDAYRKSSGFYEKFIEACKQV